MMTTYEFLKGLTTKTLLVLFRELNKDKEALVHAGDDFDQFCEVIDYVETIGEIAVSRIKVQS